MEIGLFLIWYGAGWWLAARVWTHEFDLEMKDFLFIEDGEPDMNDIAQVSFGRAATFVQAYRYVDELRRELRYSLDVQHGILHALRDAPLFPSPFVLLHLGSAAKYPEDWNRGKQLQREHGLEIIPPKTECELGAGLWDRIRGTLGD